MPISNPLGPVANVSLAFLTNGTAPAGVEVSAYVVRKVSPFDPIQGNPASAFGPNWAFNFNLGQAGDYVLVIVGAPDTDKLELNVTAAAPMNGTNGNLSPGNNNLPINNGPIGGNDEGMPLNNGSGGEHNGETTGNGNGMPVAERERVGRPPVNA